MDEKIATDGAKDLLQHSGRAADGQCRTGKEPRQELTRKSEPLQASVPSRAAAEDSLATVSLRPSSSMAWKSGAGTGREKI